MNDNINKLEQPVLLINFCQRWLQVVAIAHILGGLSLSFDWPARLWFEYRNELFQVFNVNHSDNIEIKSIVVMLTQLFGPTVASWGILMFYLVRQTAGMDFFSIKGSSEPKSHLSEEKSAFVQRTSADILILATLLWFVLDSAISLKFNMTLHLVINSVAVLSILLPLIYCRIKLIKNNFENNELYRYEN